ncbi:hypothetical protein EZV62_021504 [Acer yangbiense]|uniref:Serpin domain-containing protein n=1 Tax=Acer yangbiense TaxID=1000413 RepID=A0A5C7H6U8_9ROSI|nr:hypothetical protein EZV62_021504 [Acer yangbiense]
MDLRQLISNQTDVALSLSKHVALTEAKDSNLVFSPSSIHVVLSLIAAGSEGPTQDQLLSFLKSKSGDELNTFSSEVVPVVFADGSPSGGPRLSFANGVWIDKSLSFKDSYKQVVDNVYKAASNQVDFQTKLIFLALVYRMLLNNGMFFMLMASLKAVEVIQEVNSWAEKETSGLIKEVLPPGSVDSASRLILANALYFKGAWDEKFNASKTKDHDFHLLSGGPVKVPFMTSKKKQVIGAFDGFKVLGLPYKQGEDKRRFSMYFFLPDAKDGLPALVEKMGSESGFLDRHLPRQKVEVGDFRIPRFKISFGFETSKVLKELGVVLPFSGGDGGLSCG